MTPIYLPLHPEWFTPSHPPRPTIYHIKRLSDTRFSNIQPWNLDMSPPGDLRIHIQLASLKSFVILLLVRTNDSVWLVGRAATLLELLWAFYRTISGQPSYASEVGAQIWNTDFAGAIHLLRNCWWALLTTFVAWENDPFVLCPDVILRNIFKVCVFISSLPSSDAGNRRW